MHLLTGVYPRLAGAIALPELQDADESFFCRIHSAYGHATSECPRLQEMQAAHALQHAQPAHEGSIVISEDPASVEDFGNEFWTAKPDAQVQVRSARGWWRCEGLGGLAWATEMHA